MRVRAAIAIARPINAIIAFLAVITGAASVGQLDAVEKILVASISASLILMSGNAVNDAYDIEADRINKPQRPIPKGCMSKENAIMFSVILAVMGVGLATPLGAATIGVALFYALAFFAYAVFLKPTGLPGNILVSSATGACFVFGAIAVNGVNAYTFILAGCAFLLNLGREIVKGVEDMPGDRVRNSRTIALVHGPAVAARATILLYSLVMPISALPFILGYVGLPYLFLISVADLTVCWTMLQLRQLTQSAAQGISKYIKASMAVGLLAFLVGSVLR